MKETKQLTTVHHPNITPTTSYMDYKKGVTIKENPGTRSTKGAQTPKKHNHSSQKKIKRGKIIPSNHTPKKKIPKKRLY